MVVTTEGFARRARVSPPPMPGGELTLSPPPEVPRAVPGNLLTRLLPVVMVVAVIGMVGLMFVTGGRQMMSNPLFLMFPMMMLMSMVGMFASGRSGNGGKRAAELNEERKDYFRYLGQLRRQVRDSALEQRDALAWSHSDPAAAHDLIGSRRMWERRSGDNDFAHVRIGVGAHRLAVRLMPPEVGPIEDLEPVSMVALRRFVRTHSVVHGMPTAISLRGFPAVAVGGPREQTRGLVRAMLISLAMAHAPDQLRIAVVTADPAGPLWDWIKWLPHAGHPSHLDALGPVRMIYPDLSALEGSLADELRERSRFSRSAPPVAGQVHLVVVIDDGRVAGDERIADDSGIDGVSVIDIADTPTELAVRRGLHLNVSGGRISARSSAGVEEFADMDALSIPESLAAARRLARYRLTTAATLVSLESDAVATDPGLTALLGIRDATAFDPVAAWRPRSGRDRLRVPVGYTASGARVELDIKESAHGGMGPHGLCVGATGSGKSEFLRTLVLALIATHSPTELNLVLVDFKGGATFLGLERARHVAAVITNLEQELAMVDRMKDALSGEMNRRQEILRAAGNFANVGDYERARSAGADLAPLPALFIVVDEFSELLSQKPDFAELFVAIGRLGRSLHIHLLLASQRLEEGKLRGLDSHLSYRIGLKTFSANESRSVLGVPDAYHLPSVPGSGYLKCDSAEPIRFNASYVSGPYEPPAAGGPGPGVAGGPGAVTIVPFGAETVAVEQPSRSSLLDRAQALLDEEPVPDLAPTAPPAASASLLQTLLRRIEGHGTPAHEVWLPPLDKSPTVGRLSGHGAAGTLRLAVGIIDRPADQRRDPQVIDLSGAAGSVAIAGGPQSGKSTAVRTVVLTAAATHTPEQVQFYCLDFGGGSLVGLAGLPHVGSVCTRGDMDGVRRTIAEVAGIVRAREARFARHGIESMRDYRSRRAHWLSTGVAAPDDDLTDDRHGDVFLVLDGIAALRSDLESLEDTFTSIVSQGLSYGVHVIVTATRWAEVRPAIKDLLGTRIELRLGDPIDSELGRRAAALVPQDRPGRGVAPGELHMLIALPRLDASSSTDDLTSAVASAVHEIGTRFPDRAAPPVRRLGTSISTIEVADAVAAAQITLGPGQVAIGIGESELAPVILDFGVQPHLMAFADIEHGKTTLLRTIIHGLVGSATPEQVKIVLVDYRRTLLGVVDDDYLAGSASSAQTATQMMTQLAAYLTARMPPEDVTPQQLRDRSWWSGPDVVLIVDDYDMVATAGANPLLALLEVAANARDVGLRIVLTRRAGGVARALFDPLITRLRELSCDVLLMSGDREEGFIVGRSRMRTLVPGRGELVSRNRPTEMVQVAMVPPEPEAPEPEAPDPVAPDPEAPEQATPEQGSAEQGSAESEGTGAGAAGQ
ncbi:type VII secretion protein EccCa [Gordonia pseudamarae]|uniref:Type VII secretion protein EccCa n=1 Tax=Gordonia pseudamarae TaxID=2831662 RepID=A0ABX6IHL3_9ACTN|nr:MULTISPECIES: type VII secretion protein EccCa [Gordonia]MBD0020450.1 type VII secretion protein EccCa [Gordonia sp. (in: high G+C Gram-positive bacteria)]QHN25699.1 type VII secretion protein EccCa [Gordonia pseudamarae]QHN34631.1 type VII secretion protein EccCa [Gordonia pseudamarae]